MRVEEVVNYFSYDYEPPADGDGPIEALIVEDPLEVPSGESDGAPADTAEAESAPLEETEPDELSAEQRDLLSALWEKCLHLGRYPDADELDTIFLGGGTPTFTEPTALEQLLLCSRSMDS